MRHQAIDIPRFTFKCAVKYGSFIFGTVTANPNLSCRYNFCRNKGNVKGENCGTILGKMLEDKKSPVLSRIKITFLVYYFIFF